MPRLQLPTFLQRTCLDCGFLVLRDYNPNPETDKLEPKANEALSWAREAIRSQIPEGAPPLPLSKLQALDPVFCHKYLWKSNENEALYDVAIYEGGQVSRWRCKGFHPYMPGRGPRQHKALEDERRASRRQLRLAFLAFLGALLGASLPGLITWLRGTG